MQENIRLRSLESLNCSQDGKNFGKYAPEGGKRIKSSSNNNELSFFGANSAAKKSRKKGDFSSRKKDVAKSQKLSS